MATKFLFPLTLYSINIYIYILNPQLIKEEIFVPIIKIPKNT